MDTFVVRVWGHADTIEEPSREGLRTVRGVVEHVASGRSAAFRGLGELGALILAEVGDEAREFDPDSLAAVEALAFQETGADDRGVRPSADPPRGSRGRPDEGA